MTTNTPWQVRFFRTLEFIGLCGLACGSMIGRPAYYWIGLGLGTVGTICQTMWHFSHAPARDLARTGDSAEARA